MSIYDENPGFGSGSPYMTNTTGPSDSNQQQEEVINPITHPELEVFECVKCSHPNVLKKTPRRRRQTRVRHIRMDDVTYSSLKRYSIINGVDLNYGILLLLMHAKTQNVDYIVNENAMTLALNKNMRGKGKKKKEKK